MKIKNKSKKGTEKLLTRNHFLMYFLKQWLRTEKIQTEK